MKVLLAILLVSLALGGLFYAFSGYLFPSNNGLLPSSSGLARPSGPADLTPLLNTTCTYAQFTAALNAAAPDIAEQLSKNSNNQWWLNEFFKSQPDRRQQMLTEAFGDDTAPAADLLPLIEKCNSF